MFVAALLCVVANAADVINIGSYESTLDAGYTRFGEPAVTIEDENHVTVPISITYHILYSGGRTSLWKELRQPTRAAW